MPPSTHLDFGGFPNKYQKMMRHVRGRSSMGTFDKLGKVSRFVKYSQREYPDNQFIAFCERRGLDVTTMDYAIAKGSISAGWKAFLKYDRPEPVYDEKAMATAETILYQSYGIVKRSGLCPNYIEMMEKQTSPGYPWSTKHTKKSTAVLDHEVLKYMHKFVHATEYMPAIASNTVKREPKKKAKIESNDLRVIMALPMEMSAKGLWLFGDMNENICEAGRRGLISSWVGATKYHLGINDLYHRLNRLPNAMEMDFSSFDGSLDRRTLTTIMNLRLSMYHPDIITAELVQQVRHYYQNVIHTITVMEDGNLYRKNTGNPSGQYNTITDNSMANELRWLYAWVVNTPPEYHTLQAFKTHVELVVVGDDSLLTISDDVKMLYNPHTIGKVFLEMKWGAKFAAQQFMKLKDCQFCSMYFRDYGDHIVPVPTNPDKILVSMAFGGEVHNIRATLQRAMGMRMDVFFDQKLFAIFDDYVTMLFEKYADQLKHPVKDEPTLQDLMAMRKSVPELRGLYLTPLIIGG